MAWCFDAITSNSATIMHLEDYGISVGSKANFNLLQAKDTIEAIRLRAHRLAVIRNGKLIAGNNPLNTELHIQGRPHFVDPASYAPK
jgi:cytosine deaminase